MIPKEYIYLNDIQEKLPSDQIKYWEDLIQLLKEDDFYILNQYINDFVEYMEKVFLTNKKITLKESERILIFSRERVSIMNDSIPSIIKKLQETVESVSNEVGFLNTKVGVSQMPGLYGYLVDLKKNEIDTKLIDQIFYGIDYSVWEKKLCWLLRSTFCCY